jgi:hypothetical protein
LDVVDLKNCVVDASGELDKKRQVFAILTGTDQIVTLQAASDIEM